MFERKAGYHGLGDGRWEWAVYPKKEEGARFAGCIDGDQEKAVAACKMAIDEWIAAKSKSKIGK